MPVTIPPVNLVERLSEFLLLADPNDRDELAALAAMFGELLDWAEGGDARILAATKRAHDRLAAALVDEHADPTPVVDIVARHLSAMQQIIRNGGHPEFVSFPSELGVADTDVTQTSLERIEILQIFLANRHLLLADLETLILALDAPHPSGDTLGDFRRLVHTLKGDAGMLMLEDVERLCHAIEDAMLSAEPPKLVDAFLAARDWLARRLEHAAGGDIPPGPVESIIERLHKTSERAPTNENPLVPTVYEGPTNEAFDLETAASFATEAKEHLAEVEAQLLSLDADPTSSEALNAVFRVFHTLKGVASFAALDDMTAIAHAAENLLDRARRGIQTLDGDAIEVVFASADAMKRQVSLLEEAISRRSPPLRDPLVQSLLEKVEMVSHGRTPTTKSNRPPAGEMVARSDASLTDAPQKPITDAVPTHALAVRENIKVDADRLDRLVDAIGELVIAESMVSQSPELAHRTQQLAHHLSTLDRLTRELHTMATSLRMVPVSPTFTRMARVVRDLAKKIGKPVEFVVHGDETELDKTVVDRIGDPLLHMVRNAIDHGLEKTVDDRRRSGKPDAGRIELSAFRREGNIFIEVRDDGRGIDRRAILAKARERGLPSDDNMSDREVFNLIFEPGFSTAECVTDLSGRGVGMDVVKRNIEALRGQIEIRSQAGHGTTFSLRLPLTLAIIDGMTLRVGGERYIVPTLSVVTFVRPKAHELPTLLGRGEMISVLGNNIPLYRLSELFRATDSQRDPTRAVVLVVESEGRQVGLLCDELLGQQQVVIKPLGKLMATKHGIEGAAIMPDGQVGLILDVVGLVRFATTSVRSESWMMPSSASSTGIYETRGVS